MVQTFGSDISVAFTLGEPVEAIYTNGVKVWPVTPSGEYYVKWWPKDLTGSFTMKSQARWLQDYSGYYSGPFSSKTYTGQATSQYYIDSSAFISTGVEIVETNLKLIGAHAFEGCHSLIYFSAQQCSSFMRTGAGGTGTYTFRYCDSLKEVYCENLTFLGQYTFDCCYQLMYVSLPNCSVVGAYAFNDCWVLENIELPACTNVDDNTFRGCRYLRTVTLPVCGYIGEYAFTDCADDLELTLASTSMCSGSYIGHPPATASIYVPLSLVTAYQTAYPRYSSNFLPIPHE